MTNEDRTFFTLEKRLRMGEYHYERHLEQAGDLK